MLTMIHSKTTHKETIYSNVSETGFYLEIYSLVIAV